MSEVATKNITFWNTTGYNYPGFGKTVEVPDGLGGTISITYNKIDYDNGDWRREPEGNIPITDSRFLSGEIADKFSLTGKVNAITATMPLVRNIGHENNYSVTLGFSNYKASIIDSTLTDGATSSDTYIAISRFFNGSKMGYTSIKVTAKTLDGSQLDLTDWKLFNSGTLSKSDNTRVFLDAATQTISGKNSNGKQEFCPSPPNTGSSLATGTGLGLFQLSSNQRYISITFSFKQKKIQGRSPNDLHDIYVASNTTLTNPIDTTPQPINKPNELKQVDEAETTDTASTTGAGEITPTTDGTDTSSTTGAGETPPTTDATDTTSTTGEGDATPTTDATDTTSTTGKDDTNMNAASNTNDINTGLQLYLKCNDIIKNSEGEEIIPDLSGNNYSGKVYGRPSLNQDDRLGKCLMFDGVDDYIQLPTIDLDYSQGLTVAIWIYYKSFNQSSKIINFVDEKNEKSIVLASHKKTNTLLFETGNGSQMNIDGIIEHTKWLHLTMTIESSGNAKIYKNAELFKSDSLSLPENINRTQNYIGKSENPQSEEYFHCKMANIRVYNRALSSEEISECMRVDEDSNIHKGLQLHLKCNEIIKNSAGEEIISDLSENNYSGKVYGRPSLDKDDRLGKCLMFDGVDDYIQLPTIDLDYSEGLTVAIWIYYKSFNQWSKIINFADQTNNKSIVLASQEKTNTLLFETGKACQMSIEGILEHSQWLHLTITIDGLGNAKIYKNAELLKSQPLKLPENIERTQNYIGKSDKPQSEEYFHYKMGNIRIYNRALSSQEVSECMTFDEVVASYLPDEVVASYLPDTESSQEVITNQKPMEYQIYQVNRNPTIKTGYSASEWTAVIAGFNCGAKQKHKATALTIMPVVDDGEWKIKCDIKDADDRYWDVAVLFIRNNMVNRVSNFYR
ncbi:MAG: LamG domain-containing protein [Cyanobacteria bacterium P01_H01_bin.35]